MNEYTVYLPLVKVDFFQIINKRDSILIPVWVITLLNEFDNPFEGDLAFAREPLHEWA